MVLPEGAGQGVARALLPVDRHLDPVHRGVRDGPDQEDRPIVIKKIKEMVDKGLYPAKLWK